MGFAVVRREKLFGLGGVACYLENYRLSAAQMAAQGPSLEPDWARTRFLPLGARVWMWPRRQAAVPGGGCVCLRAHVCE